MATVAKKTKTGLAITANRIKGTGTEPKYIGWGTGASAATVDDTALQTPAAESRVECTSSVVTTDFTNDTYRIVGTITCAGSTKSISELGVYDAASGGNLFARVTFTPIEVEPGESVNFTISDKHVPAV